jgi:hypothetical protein
MLLGVLLYGLLHRHPLLPPDGTPRTEDIALRILSGNSTPDHVTVARFRVRHEQAWPGCWWPR